MTTRRTIRRWARWACLAGTLLAAIGLIAPTIQEALAADSASIEPSVTSRPASIARAFILPITGEITDITHSSLERRLNTVRDYHPELIIIELDTPGGALLATLEICDVLKRLRDKGVRVYAWINNQAYSAGTIIALATDGIVMATNATIGDCQPIQITPGGASAVPEGIEAKAMSPLLEELEDSIRRNGYDHDMVLALIRPEMEIFWLESTTTGERRFVTTEERDELFGWDDSEGGLLGLLRGKKTDKSKTQWDYVKSVPELGEVRQPIVEADKKLLTMRTNKALAYGFCIATVNDESDLRRHFNVTGTFDRLENTWIESAIEWLASPMVRAVLFLLMLLGAYTEFQTPGFGLPGGVALVALVLFLGAPYLAGYTVTWEIVAIVLGIALLAVEVFVIPGFGVAGFTGIVLLVIGLLASFVPADPTWPGFGEGPLRLPTLPATYRYLKHGLYSLAAGLTGSIIGMVLVARYFPKMPVAGRIIAPNPDHDAVQIADPYDGAARVGNVGRAESLLRPAGKARFGATLVDVVSEGEYIESGTRVEVVERRGNRVVVRRLD